MKSLSLKKILLTLLVLVGLLACTEKKKYKETDTAKTDLHLTDVPITGVWGFEFGDKVVDIYIELVNKISVDKLEFVKGDLYVSNEKFANNRYDAIVFRQYREKLCHAGFYKTFKDTIEASDFMDKLRSDVTKKYGKSNYINGEHIWKYVNIENDNVYVIRLSKEENIEEAGMVLTLVALEYYDVESVNKKEQKDQY